MVSVYVLLKTFLRVVERLEFTSKCNTDDGDRKGVAQLVAGVGEDQEPCGQAQPPETTARSGIKRSWLVK